MSRHRRRRTSDAELVELADEGKARVNEARSIMDRIWPMIEEAEVAHARNGVYAQVLSTLRPRRRA